MSSVATVMSQAFSNFISCSCSNRVKTHFLEGQERAEAVEAHLDTLDGAEKEKVNEFIKEKQFKANKDGKPLTDAQKRKRYYK